MNPNYSNYRIHEKMASLEKMFNLDKFTIGVKNTPEQIRHYYFINDWAYRHYHSQDGFMHFRVSKSGCFTDEDIYYQPDVISKYIKPGSVVLELGFGQGANLLYLARCHSDSSFIGVDLTPLDKKLKVPSNVTTYTLNYNDLSRFEDNSVDVVYAIETIVHNSDKEKIFREVNRILKPGGVSIIYDYALKWNFESYDPVLQRAIELFKGPASSIIESLDELNNHYTNCGLLLEKVTDYSRETLPDLKRLERRAARILENPWKSRVASWFLPNIFVINIIIGYLGYDGANAGLGTYHEWILRKPDNSSK